MTSIGQVSGATCLAALLLVACASLGAGCRSAPIPPTYTQDELRAICERQRGWWHHSEPRGYCEYRA